MFSIIIPSWNNLPYLKLCIESIQKNSRHSHEIIVHVNDGSDGTLEWLRNEGILHTHTPDNAGICVGVNLAAGLASRDYIVYLNDDMYCCPDWDGVLLDATQKLDTDLFMLSGTLIEPKASRNPCVIVQNHGDSTTTFDEAGLLSHYKDQAFQDWSGSSWPPTVVHRRWWHIVGGYSIEFSPGMSSDNDLAMKLWHAGCRHFIGIADARVYHFQCKSTGRIVRNDGGKTFMQKWGMTQSFFNNYYLKRGLPWQGPLEMPAKSIGNLWDRLRSKLKSKLA
jgi:GT2 family glycosyltransferase